MKLVKHQHELIREAVRLSFLWAYIKSKTSNHSMGRGQFFSTNGVGKTGDPHAVKWDPLHHTQELTQNGSKA